MGQSDCSSYQGSRAWADVLLLLAGVRISRGFCCLSLAKEVELIVIPWWWNLPFGPLSYFIRCEAYTSRTSRPGLRITHGRSYMSIEEEEEEKELTVERRNNQTLTTNTPYIYTHLTWNGAYFPGSKSMWPFTSLQALLELGVYFPTTCGG